MESRTERIPIQTLRLERHRINTNPKYQREAGIWSKEKKQLFIDSLLNGFDVPKIYFHDIREAN